MKNKKTMILLIVLAILVIIAGGLLVYKIVTKEKVGQAIEVDTNADKGGPLVVQQNQIKI